MEFNVRLIFMVIGFLIAILFFEILIKKLKVTLLKKARNKKQISNIKFLTRVSSILFLILVFFVLFFAYFKSWTGVGIFVGLITAGARVCITETYHWRCGLVNDDGEETV